MHVISRKLFNEAAIRYPNEAAAIDHVYLVLRRGCFQSPEALKKVFPSLDNFKYQDKWWVIDIGGNKLRLIVFIAFRDNRLYVKHLVNHTEYDKLCKKYLRRGG